jgi:hypothetical protein
VLKLSQIVFVLEVNKDDDAANEADAAFLDKNFFGPQYISIYSCGIVRQASTVRPLSLVVISFM